MARALSRHGSANAIIRGENTINFAGPYTRLSMYEAIQQYAGIDVEKADEQELRRFCRDNHIEIDPSMGKAKLIDEIFGEKVEDNLIQPTFIIDYPVEMSPLTKASPLQTRLG